MKYNPKLLPSLLLLISLCLGGCGKVFTADSRGRGSALWVAGDVEDFGASDLARLKAGGVDEVFVEVAHLRVKPSGLVLEPKPLPELPPSTRVTLVVGGKLEAGSIGEPAATAETLAETLRQLRFDVEAVGWVPVGVHLDPRQVASRRELGELLTALRGKLDKTQLLSLSIPRDWLDDPELGKVVAAADFLVGFVYGQRVYEREASEAWDFIQMEENLQLLEATGTPYLLGLVTLGTATHLSPKGRVLARTTNLSLPELLWNRDLELRPGFSLEGVNRRVYSVAAERPSTVGKWDLGRGDSVRVVRAASSDLEELFRLLGAWNIPNHLGQVYYRLPRSAERLSLSVDNLVNAIAPEPATPEVELAANVQRRTGRGWMMRFTLSNLNGETTGLSLLDSNLLRVRLEQGRFGRVQVGDFYRYDLFRERGGEMERTFRQANILQLNMAILDGRQTLTSGDVEILSGNEPRITLEASFLLSDGRTLAVGPFRWQGGKALDEGISAGGDGP